MHAQLEKKNDSKSRERAASAAQNTHRSVNSNITKQSNILQRYFDFNNKTYDSKKFKQFPGFTKLETSDPDLAARIQIMASRDSDEGCFTTVAKVQEHAKALVLTEEEKEILIEAQSRVEFLTVPTQTSEQKAPNDRTGKGHAQNRHMISDAALAIRSDHEKQGGEVGTFEDERVIDHFVKQVKAEDRNGVVYLDAELPLKIAYAIRKKQIIKCKAVVIVFSSSGIKTAYPTAQDIEHIPNARRVEPIK